MCVCVCVCVCVLCAVGKPSLKVPIESVLGERVVSGGESTVTTGALCQLRVCGDRLAHTHTHHTHAHTLNLL